jgi:hypothetical protein
MEWAEADPDPSSPTSWAGRFAVYRDMIMSSDIKDRPWGPIGIRVAEIESLVEARFGKLETPAEIKNALKSAVPTARVKVNLSQEELNDPGIRAEIIGYLYMMSRLPDHFGSARVIKIEKETDAPLGSSASATTSTLEAKWQEHGGNLVDHLSRGTKLDVRFFPNQKFLDSDGSVIGGAMKDTIAAQIVRSYLKHLDETKAIEEGVLTEEEAFKTATLLQGLAIGVHESGHVIHHTRSSTWTGKENPQEIVQKINDILANRPDDVKTTIFRGWFSQDGLEAVRTTLMIEKNFGSIGELATLAQLETDPKIKKQLDSIIDMWQNNPLTLDATMPAYLFGDWESEEKDSLLQAILMGGLTDSGWAQFMWGEDGKSDMAERLFDDIMKFANDAGLKQETADEARAMMFNDQDTQLSAALNLLLNGRLWDDLSSQEISKLRKNWKYISSYAKDKNSSYGDRMGTIRPSIEGVAEAITARIFGFSFIKDNPEGTFFITGRNHAMTIKDGVMIDNYRQEIGRAHV